MVGEGEVELVRGQAESWSGQPVSSDLRGTRIDARGANGQLRVTHATPVLVLRARHSSNNVRYGTRYVGMTGSNTSLESVATSIGQGLMTITLS